MGDLDRGTAPPWWTLVTPKFARGETDAAPVDERCERQWQLATSCGVAVERADQGRAFCEARDPDAFTAAADQRLTQCVGRRGDPLCPAVARCYAPPEPDELSIVGYCSALRACGVGRGCRVDYRARAANPGALHCDVDGWQRECEAGIWQCDAGVVWRQLVDLARACGFPNPVDADDDRRTLRRSGCARAFTCEALRSCLDATDPSTACAARCERPVSCGVFPDAATCEATCTARFDWVRDPEDARCARDALDCDSVAGCLSGDQALCEAGCRAQERCRRADFAGCARHCADLRVEDRHHARAQYSCAIAAPNCDHVLACTPRRLGCLHRCRLELECAAPGYDDGAALVECLRECDEDDVDGCLQHLPVDASCDALRRCH